MSNKEPICMITQKIQLTHVTKRHYCHKGFAMDIENIEIWKPIPRAGNNLEVSSLGRARSITRPLVYKDGRKGTLKGGLIRGGVCANGYILVSSGSVKFYLHRLVAECFLPPCKEPFAKMTVNHKNGNKTDNRVENLEWATFKENNRHARKNGLNNQRGVNCNLAKYSDQFIRAVRNVHEKYNPTQRELAELFGLRQAHAGQIINRKTRRDI